MNEDNQSLMNDDKTQVTLFGTRQQLQKFTQNYIFEIKIGNEKIKP